MSGTRQKTQTVLAFPAARRSEAPKRAREGTEPPTATRPPERPANPDQRMEVVVERANLTVEQFPTTSRQPTRHFSA